MKLEDAPTRRRLVAMRRRRRNRQRRRLTAFSVVTVTVILGALLSMGTAFAFLAFSTSSSLPEAVADQLPQGATPVAQTVAPRYPSTPPWHWSETSRQDAIVKVSFPTVSTIAGTPVSSYSVTRYDAYTGTSAGPIGGSCSVTSTTVTCFDAPGPGSWTYTDTPRYGANWTGQESARSNQIFVAVVSPPNPPNGTVGSSVQISVRGFLASKSLTVTVGGSDASVTSGGTTDANGNATVTLTIPTLPGGAAPIVVSDGANTEASTADFVVNAALTLSPSSSKVGTSGIIVSGTGYLPGKRVAVSFAGSPLNLNPANPLVEANGTWSAEFTVPPAPLGPTVITARDTGGSIATTSFIVTPSFSKFSRSSATATGLSPTSGNAGALGVRVSVQGFPAGQALTVTVGNRAAIVTSGGTTNSNGQATVIFTIPSLPSGRYKVTVSDRDISASSGTSFTVDPGSPPEGTTGPITVDGCVIEPKTDCADIDLADSDLKGADLTGANFTGVNLSGANLSGANLSEANFTGTKLSGANLAGAELSGVLWKSSICPNGEDTAQHGGVCG